MAHGMKAWIVLVLGGFLLAVWLVPALMPESPFRSAEALMGPEALARQEAIALAAALQRLRWLDTIDARWDEASRDGLLLGVDPDSDDAPALRGSVQAMLSNLEGEGDRVGYALVRADFLMPTSPHVIRLPPWTIPFHLLDPASGRCVVVQSVESERQLGFAARRLARDRGRPGPCGIVARYGAPGDSIRAWLARGGSAFALGAPASSASIAGDGGAAEVPRGLYPAGERCLQGDERACVTLLREPLGWFGRIRPAVEYDPALSTWSGRAALGGAGGGMLADLAAEVGPDRFAEFWRAQVPVERALARATGRPAGAWVGDWARSEVDVPALRAGPGLVDVLITIVVLAVLSGVAVVVAARRGRSPAL